jgi:hypothetical protein
MRLACLLMVCVLCSPGLAAQTSVRPAPPLDSARAALRDALLVLRDTLLAVDGAAARLQRDFRQASSASLLSRARVMRDACARSVRTVRPTRQVVIAASLSDSNRLKRRHELVTALDQLREVLSRCEMKFAAMSQRGQEETVRGYANDRAVRVQSALRRYEQSLRNFLGAMGIWVRPLGVQPGSAG